MASMSACFCGCGSRVKFSQRRLNRTGEQVTQELRRWEPYARLRASELPPAFVRFRDEGEAATQVLAACIHDRRDPSERFGDWLVGWLHHSELQAIQMNHELKMDEARAEFRELTRVPFLPAPTGPGPLSQFRFAPQNAAQRPPELVELLGDAAGAPEEESAHEEQAARDEELLHQVSLTMTENASLPDALLELLDAGSELMLAPPPADSGSRVLCLSAAQIGYMTRAAEFKHRPEARGESWHLSQRVQGAFGATAFPDPAQILAEVASEAAAGYLAERDERKWLTEGMGPEEAARICSGSLKILGRVGPDSYQTVVGVVRMDPDSLERLWLYGYLLAHVQETVTRLTEGA